MTVTENKGMIARTLEGKERTDVERKSVPANMFTLFKDIAKGRLGKLVLVNFILLLSFAPIIAVYVFRYYAQLRISALGPYGSGLTFGYPIVFDPDYGPRMQSSTDLLFFALYIPASAIAAVGLAGAASLCRNLLLTEGIFSWGDFVRGIKKSYMSALSAALIFSVLLFLAQTVSNYADWFAILNPSQAGWMITSKTIGYLLVALCIPVSLFMLTLGANYKLGFFPLLKSAFALTFRLFPLSIFYAALSVAPIFLVMFGSSILFVLGFAYYLLIGFSLGVFIFSSYSRWTFDRFLPPVVKSQEPVKSVAVVTQQVADVRTTSVAFGKSGILSRPILPLAEGGSPRLLEGEFTRADLVKAESERAALSEEQTAYERLHEGEEKYVEYNRRFEQREKMIDGGKKKKRTRPPKMLNNR